MKIDEMLKREDFFCILQSTLNDHFTKINSQVAITASNCKNSYVLYTFDKLNAIISEQTSKQVKEFLKTEYAVEGTLFRKLLVNVYLKAALQTRGLLSNKVKLYLKGVNKNEIQHILIYPCNKKIRIFNFDNNEIDVVSKTGFPSDSIKKEIEFRTKYKSPHIEPIIDHGDNWYRERIIDGTPLARINNLSEEYINLKRKSLDIMYSIAGPYRRSINASDYLSDTIQKIRNLTETAIIYLPSIQHTLDQILKFLNKKLTEFEASISLTLSHGDFHHGNIWHEKTKNNLIIIDWETCDLRTEWYDAVTLFGGLREINGIKHLLKNIYNSDNHELAKLIGEKNFHHKIFLVLLEDLLFRANDVKTSTIDIGVVEFDNYCRRLLNNLLTNN